jgi:acyl-CoA synthetase (AMP-forming)/AMP-acid ligase II
MAFASKALFTLRRAGATQIVSRLRRDTLNAYPAATIEGLLAAGRTEAPALGAPGRAPMSYGALRALCKKTATGLASIGVGRADRVAIVLPNGPEMAACFVAIAACATAAPLNPAYRADEFDFYLSDLGARALLVMAGAKGPARDVAVSKGIPILELVPGDVAGDFELVSEEPPDPRPQGLAVGTDIALVLHTSGTTSRPKIVPLSQANVVASAYHIAGSLRLEASDLCLNIMPLFHIHGLIAAVLASLASGACVCCTPGFNAFSFFGWMAEQRPTWFTAVPTMHQTLLPLAARNRTVIETSRLRLIRSSSASLPPQVMVDLEAAFGVPVVEAYGMTEAAHQMACNPLPPAPRFPGSVGIAAGPQIAILDDVGNRLPSGELGEVVIRGSNVMAGYENNPQANAAAFTDGWFRTGDQGYVDADGYLRLTGRLKEIINRGGEKVAPLEIDAVLMEHPAVQQCVTFAMPHDKLGEDVAAAVVLREGQSCDERLLREFAAGRLAAFKVPRKIVFVAEIPKGATGKLQRIGLAEKLGLSS